MKRMFLFLIGCTFFFGCVKEKILYPGMQITASKQIAKDTFLFADTWSGADPTLIITGRDLILDFGGSVIIGSKDLSKPEDFTRVALYVKGGTNITIKNLTIRGYATAVFAEDVEGLRIENCDFSYTRRLPLADDVTKVKFPGTIDLTNTSWLDPIVKSTAVFLKNCAKLVVSNTKMNNGQNGILLQECNQGLFYNNSIQYNAGLGIGLYQSNSNQFLFNQLDFNHHGEHLNTLHGGIKFLGECKGNRLAYNSITHSGADQLFYEGTTRRELRTNTSNLIEANDFAYAPNYGIIKTPEGTNQVTNNYFTGCQGEIVDDEESAFTDRVTQRNLVEQAIQTQELSEAIQVNTVLLQENDPQGCQYIIMDGYGPYNFDYPKLLLRKKEEGLYTFAIFGPPGNWEAKGGEGFKRMSLKRGAIPATLVLQADSTASKKVVELEYIGPSFKDAFGRTVAKGEPVKLKWQE